MVPVQAPYPCQPLPRVSGPPVSEDYGLICLPGGPWLPFLCSESPPCFAFAVPPLPCRVRLTPGSGFPRPWRLSRSAGRRARLSPGSRNRQGLPSAWRFSPRIPRSVWTPADPRSTHLIALAVLAAGPLPPSPSALEPCVSALSSGAVSRLQGGRAPFRAAGFPVDAPTISFGFLPPPSLRHSVRVVA